MRVQTETEIDLCQQNQIAYWTISEKFVKTHESM